MTSKPHRYGIMEIIFPIQEPTGLVLGDRSIDHSENLKSLVPVEIFEGELSTWRQGFVKPYIRPMLNRSQEADNHIIKQLKYFRLGSHLGVLSSDSQPCEWLGKQISMRCLWCLFKSERFGTLREITQKGWGIFLSRIPRNFLLVPICGARKKVSTWLYSQQFLLCCLFR